MPLAAALRVRTFRQVEAARTQPLEDLLATAIADIQGEVVKAEQGVSMAELRAQAQVKQASGEADSTRLRASAEREAIRLTGEAKAEAYRAGVGALGAESYTAVQLMQIVAERGVRVVPDVAVSGNGGAGLADGLLASLLRHGGVPSPGRG